MYSGSCRNRGFRSTRFAMSLKPEESKTAYIPQMDNTQPKWIIFDAMHLETWETWELTTFPTFFGVVLSLKLLICPEETLK